MLNRLLNNFTTTGTSDGARLPGTNITILIKAAYGGTPTFSIQLEGSMDNSTFSPIVTVDASDTAVTPTTNAISHTYTTGSPIVLFTLRQNLRFEYYRLNVTANTNVTLDAWISGNEI